MLFVSLEVEDVVTFSISYYTPCSALSLLLCVLLCFVLNACSEFCRRLFAHFHSDLMYTFFLFWSVRHQPLFAGLDGWLVQLAACPLVSTWLAVYSNVVMQEGREL